MDFKLPANPPGPQIAPARATASASPADQAAVPEHASGPVPFQTVHNHIWLHTMLNQKEQVTFLLDAVVEQLPVGITDVFPEAPSVDGLLGVDFLERFTVTLDRATHQLWLTSPQTVKTVTPSDHGHCQNGEREPGGDTPRPGAGPSCSD